MPNLMHPSICARSIKHKTAPSINQVLWEEEEENSQLQLGLSPNHSTILPLLQIITPISSYRNTPAIQSLQGVHTENESTDASCLLAMYWK